MGQMTQLMTDFARFVRTVSIRPPYILFSELLGKSEDKVHSNKQQACRWNIQLPHINQEIAEFECANTDSISHQIDVNKVMLWQDTVHLSFQGAVLLKNEMLMAVNRVCRENGIILFLAQHSLNESWDCVTGLRRPPLVS